jgi:hypothetical protein
MAKGKLRRTANQESAMSEKTPAAVQRETQDSVQTGSHIGELVQTWISKDQLMFADWVRSVSRAFYLNRLTLEGAAILLDTSPAELQAVLQLATMEEDDLNRLSELPPPKTTWFSFASADSDGVVAGIAALREMDRAASPFRVVNAAVREVSGPGQSERVGSLSGNTFMHMAHKAKQYDSLSPKARQFLGSIGRRKKSGTPLTPKQIAYAINVLTDLVDAKVVTRSSPDGDQEHCDAVLDALGV